MEIGGEGVPVVDIEKKGSCESTGDRKTGLKPLRVGAGGASVGTEAGKLHCAALTRVKSSSDLSTSTNEVMDLCQTSSDSTNTNDSEGPTF